MACSMLSIDTVLPSRTPKQSMSRFLNSERFLSFYTKREQLTKFQEEMVGSEETELKEARKQGGSSEEKEGQKEG